MRESESHLKQHNARFIMCEVTFIARGTVPCFVLVGERRNGCSGGRREEERSWRREEGGGRMQQERRIQGRERGGIEARMGVNGLFKT